MARHNFKAGKELVGSAHPTLKIKKGTAIMDLNSLENMFKEKAWIINPFYKLLVLIVYVGGPLAALFVLMFTYKSPNTTIFIAVIILLSLVIGFKFGPSTFFIVNCSWIYFRFDKFGMWLPIIAYVIGLTILGLQMAADRILTPSNE